MSTLQNNSGKFRQIVSASFVSKAETRPFADMLRRRVTRWEAFDIDYHADLALAFQVADKSAVPHILDNLDRSVIGLHLKFTDGDFVTVPSPSHRYRIPDDIRDLHRTTYWLNDHHPINYSDRLGYLAFNDSKVILNLNHSVSDGGYLKFLTSRLFETPPTTLPSFPATMEELFHEEFERAEDIAVPLTYDLDLTRTSSHHQRLNGRSSWGKYETLRFRGKDLPFFDRRLKKFRDTTDYCWLGLTLACAIHDAALPSHAGIATCVDLRPRLKRQAVGYSHLKTFSVLDARTPLIPSMTLREAGRKLRTDMRRRESELEDMARMKFCEKPFTDPPLSTLGLEITNMGPIKIKWPIVDAWASLRIAPVFGANSLAIMAFSVMGEKKSDLVVRLRFTDSLFGEDEAFAMAQTINHFMRYVPLDRTVQSAFDELRDVQASNR
jgi:hypothetical protein